MCEYVKNFLKVILENKLLTVGKTMIMATLQL